MACQSDTCVLFIESITGIDPHVARYLLFHNVMNNPFKYILSIAAITAALTLQAKATFVVEPPPIAEPPHFEKFFADAHHASVLSFTGTVGGHATPFTVDVTTTGRVETDAGFGEIKPAKASLGGTTLTDLIFTPTNPNLFSDFNFRGQINLAGTVSIKVTNQFGVSQTFTSPMFAAEEDFPRVGVIAVAGSGETISQVEIFTTSDTFKSVKQIAFSFAGPPPPTPDGGATVMLLGTALGALGIAQRYLKS